MKMTSPGTKHPEVNNCFYVLMPFDLVAGIQNRKQSVSWCALEDVCVRRCEVGGILALSCVSSYSHYCSSPLSYERRDESSWHLRPLLHWVCVCRQSLLSLPLCVRMLCLFVFRSYMCVLAASQLAGTSSFTCWMFLEEAGCSSALSSLRPGATEWVRLTESLSEGEMECA